MLRMVLRSTPVNLAISRWLAPFSSSVMTVVRLLCFKTYILHAPLDIEGVRLRPASGIAPRRHTSLMAGSGAQGGEFDPARSGGICLANGENVECNFYNSPKG
jgi:hypothetical protein